MVYPAPYGDNLIKFQFEKAQSSIQIVGGHIVLSLNEENDNA